MDKKEKVVETIMDVMESLSNYSEEEQNQIITTLTVIQERGWSHDVNDPYQFQIILGEKLMSQTKRIKSFENNLESLEEENLQKDKYIKDLKADLEHHKDVTEDMEQEINKRDDVINALQYGIDGKIKVINDLVQIRKVNLEENEIMEKKLKVQNKVLKELKDKLNEKDELKNQQEELQKLFDDIEHLKDVNKEKEIELENVSSENEKLKSRLESIAIEEEVLQDKPISLEDELGSLLSRDFKCGKCGEDFGSQGNLSTHMKRGHEVKNERLHMKLRLYEIEMKISEQKLYIANKMSSLREIEFSESQTCKCQGWCGINHIKHSWKVTKSERVYEMIRSLDLNLVA